MEIVTLGKSDLKVTNLCYGCMRIAGGWSPDAVSRERIEQGIRTLETVVDHGINFIDHADIYCHGKCEEIFGEALKRHPEWKGKLIVATKCGIRFAGVPDADSPARRDFSREYIVRSVESSLKRLGLEVIDLYQLHRPDYLGDPEEVATAFEQLHAQGKVRFFGVSNFSPSQVSMYQSFLNLPLITNQVEIHLLNQERFTDGTLDQCLEKNMTPLAWSPIAQGRLGNETEAGPINMKLHGLHKVLDDLAAKYGISRSSLAMAWLTRHPAGIIPILGTSRPERVVEAVGELGGNFELDREDWYRLFTAARGEKLA
jgi:predicted oxidoreductase